MIWLIISGWLLMGAAGYLLARATSDSQLKWTNKDRLLGIGFGLLMAPVLFLTGLLCWLDEWFHTGDWLDKEAKW